eukprot:Platyproteum_vivax@DN1001_c0_g2_i1.p1
MLSDEEELADTRDFYAETSKSGDSPSSPQHSPLRKAASTNWPKLLNKSGLLSLNTMSKEVLVPELQQPVKNLTLYDGAYLLDSFRSVADREKGQDVLLVVKTPDRRRKENRLVVVDAFLVSSNCPKLHSAIANNLSGLGSVSLPPTSDDLDVGPQPSKIDIHTDNPEAFELLMEWLHLGIQHKIIREMNIDTLLSLIRECYAWGFNIDWIEAAIHQLASVHMCPATAICCANLAEEFHHDALWNEAIALLAANAYRLLSSNDYLNLKLKSLIGMLQHPGCIQEENQLLCHAQMWLFNYSTQALKHNDTANLQQVTDELHTGMVAMVQNSIFPSKFFSQKIIAPILTEQFLTVAASSKTQDPY